MTFSRYILLLMLFCHALQGIAQKNRRPGDVPPPPPHLLKQELVPVINLTQYPPVITMLPAGIKTKLTGYHERIRGTRLFIQKSARYTYHSPLFKKNDDTFFFFSDHEQGFGKMSDSISNALKSVPRRFNLEKEFTHNQSPAKIFESIDSLSGESALAVVIEHGQFTFFGVFSYNVRDRETANEFAAVILSLYHKSDYPLDPMDNLHFSFDKEIAGFSHISMVTSGIIVSPDSLFNQFTDVFNPNYQLYEMGRLTLAQVKATLDNIPNVLSTAARSSKEVNYETRIINDNLVVISEYENVPIGDAGKIYYSYHAMVLDKNRTVFFNGFCKEKPEKFRETWLKIIESVKFLQ